MPRYLSSIPAHTEFLDKSRLPHGFALEFFRAPHGAKLSSETENAVNRAKFAVVRTIETVEKLAKDTSRTFDEQNSLARKIVKQAEKEIVAAADTIRKHETARKDAATKRALASFKDADQGLGWELRQMFKAKAASGDPEWPVELSRLVKSDPAVAAAVCTGPAILSGISNERQQNLIMEAMVAFAPEDSDEIIEAEALVNEADRLLTGARKLNDASYSTAHADRADGTRVDAENVFTTPGE